MVTRKATPNAAAQGRPALQIKRFPGMVLTKNWIRWIDGRQYDGFVGTVSIYSDVEATGFKAEGHNTANWIARVEGPSGDSVNLLGCQVAAIHQTSKKPPEAPQPTILAVP